jgi:hypothetical protein
MNVSSESTTHKTVSSSARTTTLYDLMVEINASTCGPESGNIICEFREPVENSRNRTIVEKVARMFESGQIRFMNIQDVKRKYAEWLI